MESIFLPFKIFTMSWNFAFNAWFSFSFSANWPIISSFFFSFSANCPSIFSFSFFFSSNWPSISSFSFFFSSNWPSISSFSFFFASNWPSISSFSFFFASNWPFNCWICCLSINKFKLNYFILTIIVDAVIINNSMAYCNILIYWRLDINIFWLLIIYYWIFIIAFIFK